MNIITHGKIYDILSGDESLYDTLRNNIELQNKIIEDIKKTNFIHKCSGESLEQIRNLFTKLDIDDKEFMKELDMQYLVLELT